MLPSTDTTDSSRRNNCGSEVLLVGLGGLAGVVSDKKSESVDLAVDSVILTHILYEKIGINTFNFSIAL